jgi:hypothetical protein
MKQMRIMTRLYARTLDPRVLEELRRLSMLAAELDNVAVLENAPGALS